MTAENHVMSNLSHIAAVLRWIRLAIILGFLASCGASVDVQSTRDEASPSETSPIASYTVSEFSELGSSLLAPDLSTRVTNLEFDVYAVCTNGNTNSFTKSSYVLGTTENFTLGADCISPEVHLENIDVTYENVAGTQISDTLANYADQIDNENSILIIERTVTGKNAEFELREITLARDQDAGDVEISPSNITAVLETDPNSWCSGITVTVGVDTITAQFDLPESGSLPGNPTADYTFTANGDSTLPAGTVETEDSGNREVEYDFSAVTEGSYGNMNFDITLTPDNGEIDDDHYCEANVDFDLIVELENHTPTIAYDANANVANFSGFGTSGDPYTFDVTNNSSNGEVSFTITDFNDQTDGLIECTSAPGWVNIDDVNDKITFSPTSTSNNNTFNCNADDGTIDSVRTIYFDVNVVP